MRKTAITWLAAAGSVLTVAGCGGGGSGDAGISGGGLHLTGVAATGMALANSTVEVKCATGTGTATTDGNGAYTIIVTSGALPCMLRVTGDVNGTTVSLHSVADSGATDGATTTATANVTPLTEIIVAQMAGTMPSELFDAFEANHGQVTPGALSTATSEVLDALRDQASVDFGATDPFKSTLVAATPGNPGAGNAHDGLLDALGAKVDIGALPQIANQIVAAKTAGAGGPVTLANVMTALDRGNLAGCPAALSGNYRLLQYFGYSWTREFDFKNGKMYRPGMTDFNLTAVPNEPCRFRASEGAVEFDVVMGPAGIGAWRARNTDQGVSWMGYIFPVQAHPLSALVGKWSYLFSGEMTVFPSELEHSVGQMDIAASGNAATCDYDVNTWECIAEDYEDEPVVFVSKGNGVFGLADPDVQHEFYPYRAPSGTYVVFGSANPTADFNNPKRAIFVASRLQALALPTIGDITKYWEVETLPTNLSPAVNGFLATGPTAHATVVTAVDAAAGTFSRERQTDGRLDTLRINHPLDGVRHRAAATWNHPTQGTLPLSGIYQIPLSGLGIAITVNEDPANHFYNVAVVRP